MPLDDYDLGHKISYNFTINVYNGDNINNVISEFLVQNALDPMSNEYLIENIVNSINSLRNGLTILDSRNITNIGSRIHFKTNWILIQVWRGSK